MKSRLLGDFCDASDVSLPLTIRAKSLARCMEKSDQINSIHRHIEYRLETVKRAICAQILSANLSLIELTHQ